MPIRVLVVDDSLFMRRLVSDSLNADPAIEVVATAKDGNDALSKTCELRPDCITLDLVMPTQGGLAALEHIMSECPTPVVILSAHSKESADITMKCLNAGAVGFVPKPSGELSLDIEKITPQLIREVKAAAALDVASIKSLIAAKPRRRLRSRRLKAEIIVIGASTGGPQTLRTVLSSLPLDFPAPILVVQHMPAGSFAQSLAEDLDQHCELSIKLAEDGEMIRPATVYVAPGGFEMTLKRHRTPTPKNKRNRKGKAPEAAIWLTEAEPDGLNPTVDITMQSVVAVYEGNTIGIILTGMGHDGREGMKAIKDHGGKTIAQDESSLIFGMPKAVIDAGHADKVLPASSVAGALMDMARSTEPKNSPRRPAVLCKGQQQAPANSTGV